VSGLQVPAPPQGTHAATTDQTFPSSQTMTQTLVLEPGLRHTLDFTLYYENTAGLFATPDTLDYGTVPNQQYRVDVLRASAPDRSVAAADVLLPIFRTDVGEPSSMAPTRITADLTRFRGSTVKLRFAEVDNQGNFGAQVDAVHITSQPLPIDITVNDASRVEGDSGQTGMQFTVRLSAPSARTVTVGFITADGTASRLSDYRLKQGTFTFAPGETTKHTTVMVNGDLQHEADETLSVVLFNSTNARIVDPVGAGVIRNDD
jgi:hypothetical protein